MTNDDYDGWDRVLKELTPIYKKRWDEKRLREAEAWANASMPVGSQSSRKAAQRKTERSRKVSKAIGRAKGGLKNRRNRKVTW